MKQQLSKEKKFFSVDGETCIRMKKTFSAAIGESTTDFKGIDDLTQSKETYSVQSIRERMKMQKFTPRRKFSRFVKNWQKYVKGEDFSSEERVQAEKLFINDIMSVFNDITHAVREGGKVNTLLGTSILNSKEVNRAVKDLNLIYRKSLKSELHLGDVPKAQYIKLKEAMRDFFNALSIEVFGESIDENLDNTIPLK